ncbi:hypothetical protein B6U67_05730 [Methanosarcinales archaeon ex4484_138]|nr:MAG: hypothetical protein B6U67_05730 [Methanosarcinales archaeon ex4484_138]
MMKIQPEERLAATSELNPAPSLVTGCGEARGMGYWAATQVKGLSREKRFKRLTDQFIVPLKRGNVCGGKGLAVEPLGHGHTHRTKRRVKDGNKTGLIAASGRWWL